MIRRGGPSFRLGFYRATASTTTKGIRESEQPINRTIGGIWGSEDESREFQRIGTRESEIHLH